MKVLVEEVSKEGLEALLGKNITLFCGVYIYTGKLVGVNQTCVKLDNPYIVYETGELLSDKWKDAQVLKSPWYVQCQAIESFGCLNKS